MTVKPLAAIAVLAALSACAPQQSSEGGPPEWFLRKVEQHKLAAAREGGAQQGPSLRVAVATDRPLPEFSERLADVVERCWVGGEPGWRVDRSEGFVAMVQTKPVGSNASAEPRTMLSMETKPGPAVGLEVTARGPLARPGYRPRVVRAIDKAKAAGPVACAPLNPAG